MKFKGIDMDEKYKDAIFDPRKLKELDHKKAVEYVNGLIKYLDRVIDLAILNDDRETEYTARGLRLTLKSAFKELSNLMARRKEKYFED